MEKFHGKCMQTVIVPICKNKNGAYVMLELQACFPCNYHLQVV